MKIDCSEDAALIVNAAVNSHMEQWVRIRNSEDYLMEYKKPFDEQEKKEQLADWSSNWNFGKGRMLVEQGVVNSVSDIFRSFGMIEILFERFNEKKHKKELFQFLSNEYLRYKFSCKIGEVFADVLEKDTRIHPFLTKIEYNSYVFGYAPVIRDKFTYLGRPVFLRDIAFEDRTQFDSIRNFVVFDYIKGETLLERVRMHKDEIPEAVGEDDELFHRYSSGWIKEGIEEIFFNQLSSNNEIKEDIKHNGLTLSTTITEDGNLKITNWEDVATIQEFKGTTWMTLNVNNIFIAKIYTTDSDGEITETYVVLNGNEITLPEDDVVTQSNLGTYEYLLYQKNLGRVPYTDVVNIVKEFAINSGDYIQDYKGSSKQITEESLRYDFKRNAIEDKLLMNGVLLVQQTDSLSRERLKIQILGGVGVLPENVTLPTNQIKQDLGDHVASLQMDDADFQRRIGHYKPELKLSNRPTKDEVQAVSQEHNLQRSAKQPFKLRDYSLLFTSIFNDLVEEDYDNPIDKNLKDYFFDELLFELEEFNVDKSQLKQILKTIRGVELNAVNMDIAAIQQAMPMAQNTNGRTKLTRSFLLALGFPRRDVNIFIQVIDYGYQIEQAANENAAFYNTSEVVFDESQDHIGHLNLHFAKFDRVIKGIKAGEDIVRGFHYLTNGLINAQQHVQAIAKSFFFKNRLKEFANILKYFIKTTNDIAKLIEKQKAEAQQNGGQSQIPPEALAKIKLLEWQAQEKNKRTNWLTAQAAQRKAAEFSQKLEMKKIEADQKIENQKAIADTQKELLQLQSSLKLATL